MKSQFSNENASGQAGVSVASGQAKATCENVLRKDDSASLFTREKNDILASKSTSIEVQLEKALHLLRAGPKTTMELRDHGIMMPAARIHYLCHVDGHTINSQWVTLYDANGFRHSKYAWYHFEAEAPAKEAA